MCHVYVLHPPGGVVGGDTLHVEVGVDAGARALVTTPAATKVYRTAGAPSAIDNQLRVEPGATLEWLPNETILYDGCDLALRTRVELAPGAAFIGLELVCFGLPARNDDGFARGRSRFALELSRAGTPLVVERGRFDSDAPVHAAAWGLGGAPVMGTLLAAPARSVDADALAEMTTDLRARAEALPPGDHAGVTIAGDASEATLACRYVGPSVERGGAFLRGAWALARRTLLGRDATPPRIWST